MRLDLHDVASYLARKRKPTGSSSSLLKEFHVDNIIKILKENEISLSWFVSTLATIADNDEAKDTDRMAALDRIKEIMLLGSIQNEELILEASMKEGKQVKAEDPFAQGAPKLKVKRA